MNHGVLADLRNACTGWSGRWVLGSCQLGIGWPILLRQAASFSESMEGMFQLDADAGLSGRSFFSMNSPLPKVPEATLHVSALLGGWAGGMWAMDKFRHKTKKQPFRTMCVLYFSLLEPI